ncbi:hypothetical protein P3L10_003521 [Capsicum annuum]
MDHMDLILKASRIRPNSFIGNRGTPYWAYNSNGLFSTKSVYDSLITPVSSENEFSWIWKLRTLNKIKRFLWRCSTGKFPTWFYLHFIGQS